MTAARTTAPRTTTRRRPTKVTSTPSGRTTRSAPSSARRPGGKYVYCVIQSDTPSSYGSIGLGVEPSEVYTISYRDIAAVVSDSPIVVHEPTRANVLSHERVNELVMHDQHAVIPMSFGTVLKTQKDVDALLRAAYAPFKAALDKIEDKLEFGLKVVWDRAQIVRRLEEEDDDIRRLKHELAAPAGTATYFARMQYARLIDSALHTLSERYIARTLAALRPVSVASRTSRPIGDRMIVNAAFLVRRDRERAFEEAVRAVPDEQGALTFRHTGPWPPYSFVNIRLKVEG